MPNLLEMPWRQLIPLIPVADHTEEIQADSWLPFFQNNGLASLHGAIFKRQPSIQLSRSRLLNFSYTNARQKCVEILLWGYPTGMRGQNHVAYLQNLDKIARAATDHTEWPEYYEQLHEIGYLGIATITKLAYFHKLTFQGHNALIFDTKLIGVFAAGRWQPLHIAFIKYDTAHQHYLSYLKQMAEVSAQMDSGATPDQIEFLLFSCGKAF